MVLPKENHMQLIEAATLDRKSGEAEGSAVPRTLLGNVFRQSAAQGDPQFSLSLSGLFGARQNLRPQLFYSKAGLRGTEQYLAELQAFP